MNEFQPLLLACWSGTREDLKPFSIEGLVGHCYERIVLAPVVPQEGADMGPPRSEQRQNALHVAYGDTHLGIGTGLCQLLEEARRGHLFAVAHNHTLTATQERAECVRRPDLTGLIEDNEIELGSIRRDVLRHREGAH